ncbi:hypothetical protein V8C86DRAFT_2438358 [Haematococcus lacustris]
MSRAAAPHLLRGEDEEEHHWVWDRLTVIAPNTLTMNARGRQLVLTLDGQQHDYEMPYDVDTSHPLTATLHSTPAADASSPAGSKLVLDMRKKPNDGSHETLQRLKLEAMADNRLLSISVKQQ